MTEAFLTERGDTKALAEYQGRRADRDVFRTWIQGLREALEAIYRQGGDRAQVLKAKAETISRYTKDLRPQFNVDDLVGTEPWNNARVLGATLYSPDLVRFERAYACTRSPDVETFLKKLAATVNDYDDGFKALDSLCQKS